MKYSTSFRPQLQLAHARGFVSQAYAYFLIEIPSPCNNSSSSICYSADELWKPIANFSSFWVEAAGGAVFRYTLVVLL